MTGKWLDILRPGEWRRLPPDIYVWLAARLFRISPCSLSQCLNLDDCSVEIKNYVSNPVKLYF